VEEQLRNELVRRSRQVYQLGWVANHDGNLSVRLDEGRFLATPTSVSKGDVTPEMLVLLDGQGKLLQGTRKPFSEFKLHLAAYQARPELRAVLHAHPPTATGFAVAGADLGPPFMAEPVVSLGSEIPCVPYFFPGAEGETDAVADALRRADALLLGNHGVLTVGPDLEHCLLRMELVEHLARIALVARQLGGPKPIPAQDVQRLVEKRQAAGLGPSVRAQAERPTPVELVPSPAGGAESIVQQAMRRLGGD